MFAYCVIYIDVGILIVHYLFVSLYMFTFTIFICDFRVYGAALHRHTRHQCGMDTHVGSIVTRQAWCYCVHVRANMCL